MKMCQSIVTKSFKSWLLEYHVLLISFQLFNFRLNVPSRKASVQSTRRKYLTDGWSTKRGSSIQISSILVCRSGIRKMPLDCGNRSLKYTLNHRWLISIPIATSFLVCIFVTLKITLQIKLNDKFLITIYSLV